LNLRGAGFIGCGAMGSAFIKGMINSGKLNPVEIWAYDCKKEITQRLQSDYSLNIASNYQELLDNSNLVFLAVKPGDYPTVLKEIAPLVKDDHLIISAAAGISISYIKDYLGTNSLVVRLMPNTPCLIEEGAMAISADEKVDETSLSLIEDLVSSLGKIVMVPEKDIDAVTGLSGSGPAYVYLFLEALVEGGVKAGLDRNTAEVLALQTFKGAAEMVERMQKSPAELKSEVTSPGGTTSYGLHVLEERAIRAAISDAVGEAAKRAQKLGEKE